VRPPGCVSSIASTMAGPAVAVGAKGNEVEVYRDNSKSMR
jgi:hypothetical protein